MHLLVKGVLFWPSLVAMGGRGLTPRPMHMVRVAMDWVWLLAVGASFFLVAMELTGRQSSPLLPSINPVGRVRCYNQEKSTWWPLIAAMIFGLQGG